MYNTIHFNNQEPSIGKCVTIKIHIPIKDCYSTFKLCDNEYTLTPNGDLVVNSPKTIYCTGFPTVPILLLAQTTFPTIAKIDRSTNQGGIINPYVKDFSRLDVAITIDVQMGTGTTINTTGKILGGDITVTNQELMPKLAEWHIYGNEQQGKFVTRKPETEPCYYLGGVTNDVALKNFYRVMDKKEYELKDHLGNVRAVVGDVKMPLFEDLYGRGIPPFLMDEKAINDYYPYGMTIADRSYSSTFYRSGYNMQEKSLELDVNGNHNTAEFWEYDTRTARRWNTDPVVKPWESSYATFAGNPIYYNDIGGDDENTFMGDGVGTPSFEGGDAGVATKMGNTTTGVNPNEPVVSASSSTGNWGPREPSVEIDQKSITTNGRVKDGITNVAKNLGIPEGRHVQNHTSDAINSTLASVIPFHDAIKNIHDGTESGDNSLVAMGIIGAGLDIASFGRGGAIVRGGAKLGERLLGRPIIQGAKQVAWILEKHGMNQLAKHAHRSKFFISTKEELNILIQNATHMPIQVQSNGNILRVVDAGKIIGFDRNTNKLTSIYSVVSNPKTGNLITAYPGLLGP